MQPGDPRSASATKPSIAPPWMSARDASSVCGPPTFTRLGSWYGRRHPPRAGSGRQTLGPSSAIGIPSAPGNVPKYESNDRFSCMMTMTCSMAAIPRSLEPDESGHAVASSAAAATASAARGMASDEVAGRRASRGFVERWGTAPTVLPREPDLGRPAATDRMLPARPLDPAGRRDHDQIAPPSVADGGRARSRLVVVAGDARPRGRAVVRPRQAALGPSAVDRAVPRFRLVHLARERHPRLEP